MVSPPTAVSHYNSLQILGATYLQSLPATFGTVTTTVQSLFTVEQEEIDLGEPPPLSGYSVSFSISFKITMTNKSIWLLFVLGLYPSHARTTEGPPKQR
jgi:hypothetical protein